MGFEELKSFVSCLRDEFVYQLGDPYKKKKIKLRFAISKPELIDNQEWCIIAFLTTDKMRKEHQSGLYVKMSVGRSELEKFKTKEDLFISMATRLAYNINELFKQAEKDGYFYFE